MGANDSSIEHTTADSLHSEIVTAQQQGADFQRWKLLASAALIAAVLGLGSEEDSTRVNANLLCAIPLVCLFADLISAQVALRIRVIATYLRQHGDHYEKHIRNIEPAWIFKLESRMTWISTLLLCLFSGAYPLIAPHLCNPSESDCHWGAALACIVLGAIDLFIYNWLLVHGDPVLRSLPGEENTSQS